MNFKYISFLLFVFLSFSAQLHSQNSKHITLLSQLRIPEAASSVWGYTSPDGQEIALLGTYKGVRIYDLSIPSAPEEILFIPNNDCTWRELKTSGSFAYVVSECNDGLLVIDLTRIDSISYRNIFEIKDMNGLSYRIENSHTIFSDEEGYVYLSGARPIGAGFAILDPSRDPWNPILISQFEEDYMHEVHVRDKILYGAELFNGAFSIWDLKDRENPIKLASQETAFRFTHSVWIEEKRKILYTADETSGALVEAWDVSDPLDIQRKDFFRVSEPADVFHIPHNVFHKNDHAYLSWYTEGVRVLDTRRADNLVETGYYDTYPGAGTGFHGCWSVYPYYASGILVASDIENGMYVLKYDGNTAAWLEGIIRDQNTGQVLSGSRIELTELTTGKTIRLESDPRGQYKTGSGEQGNFRLKIEKTAYLPIEQIIQLTRDSLLRLDFELQPRPKSTAQFRVKDLLQNESITAAQVLMFNDFSSFEGSSNSDSDINCTIAEVYQDSFDILASHWGHRYAYLQKVYFDGQKIWNLNLERGYVDHFITKTGWTVISDDPIVRFEYGDFSELFPPPSNFPSKDVNGDIGTSCMYTNNFGEVDFDYRLNGHLYLISPPMDFRNFRQIRLSYYAWAYGGWDNAIQETILILGEDSMKLEDVPVLLTGQFNPKTEKLIDVEGKKRDSVRFVFHLWNDPVNSGFAIALRAALDQFEAEGTLLSQIDEKTFKNSNPFYPNPWSGELWYHQDQPENGMLKIFNSTGRLLLQQNILSHNTQISGADLWMPGIYYYTFNKDKDQHTEIGKLVKINNK